MIARGRERTAAISVALFTSRIAYCSNLDCSLPPPQCEFLELALLAATQIPKPADEQAFERASVVLWQNLLNDPNVKKNGRRGQRQNGVDLYGVRNADPEHLVGVQCKLKGSNRELKEQEVRDEVDLALTFKPKLREFFITTTAPDDTNLDELARELSVDLSKRGYQLVVHVWGWNTLEEKIQEFPDALNAFDPSHSAFSSQLDDKIDKLSSDLVGPSGFIAELQSTVLRIETGIRDRPSDAGHSSDDFDSHLDAEIDDFRRISIEGKPHTALSLLSNLQERVEPNASGRILFRIKANIGSCYFQLGETDKAASLLAEAYEHCPNDPKAIANKGLSLLLQGNWQTLLEFGAEALRQDPTNDGIAGYLVQAARFDATIDEPLDLVPDELKGSAAVAIGRIDFLRSRGATAEWRRAALDARTAYPDDDQIGQFAAEAALDEVVQSANFQRSGLLDDKQKEEVAAAIQTLGQLWERALNSERTVRPEEVALCCNLIAAYDALGDSSTALEIARQGIEVARHDMDLALRTAAIAIDNHEDELAEGLLPSLPDGPAAAVLRFRFYAQASEWQKVVELCKDSVELLPEVERTLITATARLSEIHLNPGDDSYSRLDKVISDVAEDARASVVAADFASMQGHDDLAGRAYSNAKAQINDHSHIAGRMMTAMYAARINDWSVVADLLDGHIDESSESDELHALSIALANEIPVRDRAVRFFSRLPAAIADLAFYRHAAGVMHFNRGSLDEAETNLMRAIKRDPRVDTYLVLFATLRRMDRSDDIVSILNSVNPESLDGAAGPKMRLAQEMCQAGQGARSLKYAYDVLKAARNDPESSLLYMGLILSDRSGELLPMSDSVSLDAWVRIENHNGESFDFIIEQGEDRPAEGFLSPHHAIVSASLGMKVGETFIQEAAIGERTTWRIVEIKHKYLHLLHDVMENFQTRFPDAQGFHRFTSENGNIEPMLQDIRNRAEANRQIADFYLQQHLPMAFVAPQMGGNEIELADYVRYLGEEVRVCIGTDAERLGALSLIDSLRSNGAVLDNYTAWTAANMDILDVLVEVFGRVLVPQSVIDELRIHKEEVKQLEGSTLVAWKDDEFVRQQHTSNEISKRTAHIEEQIQKIVRHCTVASSTAPDEPSQVASAVTAAFGGHVLDPANLASDRKLLISEDIYYRQHADAAVSAKGVWLLVVLEYALSHGLITRMRFADAVAQLALRRHGYVLLRVETLHDVLKSDGTPRLDYFSAVAEYIAPDSADIRLHTIFAGLFLGQVWANPWVVTLKERRATGVVLSRLVHRKGSNGSMVLALLIKHANGALRRYILDWMEGHFVSLSTVERCLVDVVDHQARRYLLELTEPKPIRALASTNWPLND